MTRLTARLWYVSYMSLTSGSTQDGRLSMSGVARGWIQSLPAGTWFRSAAVPGPKHVVRNVLSRLMTTDTPIIGRVANGIYWRQPPPSDAGYGTLPTLTHSADSVLAPAGSGYADYSALSHIGWSRQTPVRTAIAVPYRNLTPPTLPIGPPVRFIERSNRRRRDLNWNEATLLEAARSSGAADFSDWDHAMWCLTQANGWMKQDAHIRKEALLWAAQGEPEARSWPSGTGERSFDAVVSMLARSLPAVLEAV